MHAFDGQTDGRTDGQTDGRMEFSSQDRICIPCSAVITIKNKTCIWYIRLLRHPNVLLML